MPRSHNPVSTAERFRVTFGQAHVSLTQAVEAGFTRGQLRAAVDRGLLASPSRGRYAAFCPPERDDFVRAAAYHLEQCRATIGGLAPGAMAASDTAGLVVGVDSPSFRTSERVQLIHPGITNTTGPGIVIRGSGVHEVDRTVVDGIPTTGVARTAIDLARGHRLPEALIPLDSAARLLIAHKAGAQGPELRRAVLNEGHREWARAELHAALRRCFAWPGTRGLRASIDAVDPAAESPLESRSRGHFVLSRLPTLRIGYPITVQGRTVWADFCEPDLKVVGEADGWGKYGSSIRENGEAWDRERARQAVLEDDGWILGRWTSSDSPFVIVERMRRALDAGRRRKDLAT